MKRYLLFVSLTYSYSILRPIQDEIRRRGDEAAWYIEDSCPIYLKKDEKQLKTIKEVIDYNPIAIYAPGNYIYDFFPGVKVEVFHGFDINKRPGRGDHYSLKGWFDLYCTQGEMDTREFIRLSDKYSYFKAVQTGWSKLDNFFDENGSIIQSQNEKPVIMYASTFTEWITSAPHIYEEIHRLIKTKDWDWLITLHPKTKPETIELYRNLSKYKNVTFYDGDNNFELMQKADVMVCDSSSIIVEFLYLYKPVVTFRNTSPGEYLIDINEPNLLESSIERALNRPDDLMHNIKEYVNMMHPYRDGKASARILDATDDFIKNYKGRIKRKPLNIFRKFKLRKKIGYFSFRLKN